MARVHQELMNMRGVSIQMNFLQSLCLEIPPPFNFEKFGKFTLAWFRIKLKHKQNKSIQPMHWIRLTKMLKLFNCLYPNSRIRQTQPFFFSSSSSVTVRQGTPSTEAWRKTLEHFWEHIPSLPVTRSWAHCSWPTEYPNGLSLGPHQVHTLGKQEIWTFSL